MNLTPDLTGLETLEPMEIVSTLNQQAWSYIPIIIIFTYLILIFLIVGIFAKPVKRKRLIQYGEFWILFSLGLLVSIALYIMVVFFPIYINLFT